MSYPVRRPRGDRFARLFSDFFSDPYGFGGRRNAWQPDIDVTEAADAWIVEVRLPGFAPEEVNIEQNDRELAISARHEGSDTEESGGRWADFSYRFTMPSDVDGEKIEATMDHGLLTVRLPRSETSRPRRIAVGRPDPRTIEGTQS